MVARQTWFALSLLLSAAPAAAVPNDTGQVRCYDGQDLVPCTRRTAGDDAPFPRQDGRFGRDAQRLGFDFELRDGSGAPARPGSPPACVFDRTTGLLWHARVGAAAPWGDLPARVAQLNEANVCGRSDWRLPSRNELVSIVSYGGEGAAVDPRAFPAVPPERCWTGDPAVGEPAGRAWVVQFLDGSSLAAPADTALRWLAVAGARGGDAGRFERLADGTVRDRRTGLVWDQCTYGQAGAACEQGTPEKHPWAAALRVAVQANRARHKGCDDWRLPSVKELESLVDVARARPAVDPAAFPHIQSWWYWSATPRRGNALIDEPVAVWDVGLDDAHIGFGLEELAGYVLLVRGAGGFDALGGTGESVKGASAKGE